MSLSSKQLNIKPDNKKIAINVDDEWSSFISNHYEEDVSDDDVDVDNKENQYVLDKKASIKTVEPKLYNNINAPTPSNIYISTKSKIAYLTEPIDLRIFWDIPIIPYATPKNGVIKKQIKINSKSQEELDDIQSRLQKELYFDEHVMSHIDNPSGRIKFKDIRKITIGISKKDIMSYRSKKKQAFYNCFVMIIRLKIDVDFKEFHIKVFNTGKLEIPGVQNDEMFEMVLKSIIQILQPHSPTQLCYNKTSDTVLINSNFNCGFYIDREMLYDILRSKYNIQAIYDPCSYPGVQCKFYYNKDIGVQTGKQITTENKGKYTNIVEVSFMIFRTGSVLIVGMCEEDVLIEIYNFLKLLLIAEFENVCQGLLDGNHNLLKDKKKKIRKKTITILENECK
jgi:TATA-box binding protein (TBP) (component of TFIID and TFIIIB)